MSSVPPTPPVVETAPTRPWQVTVSAVLMAITGFFWQLLAITESGFLTWAVFARKDFGTEHYIILPLLQIWALLYLRSWRDLWQMAPLTRRHAVILSTIACVLGVVVASIWISGALLASTVFDPVKVWRTGLLFSVIVLLPTIIFAVVPLILLTRWSVKRAFEKLGEKR